MGQATAVDVSAAQQLALKGRRIVQRIARRRRSNKRKPPTLDTVEGLLAQCAELFTRTDHGDMTAEEISVVEHEAGHHPAVWRSDQTHVHEGEIAEIKDAVAELLKQQHLQQVT